MLRIQRNLPDRYSGASDAELESMIRRAKATLGDNLFILGHHYQRDDVIQFADARGDSFKLSVLAQERPYAKFVVFCGVHFMAESADILTNDDQVVILPDLNAGCSMADMADIDQVEEAWEVLAETIDISTIIPITYMNSSAAIKSFVGRHGGAVCTS
ncbi:MAG: quinolinate synthase NadA, partial [Acidimicrobiia bacterium]|nr:quinolinate synthase NadA [Acidimicrobiia bacterium]